MVIIQSPGQERRFRFFRDKMPAVRFEVNPLKLHGQRGSCDLGCGGTRYSCLQNNPGEQSLLTNFCARQEGTISFRGVLQGGNTQIPLGVGDHFSPIPREWIEGFSRPFAPPRSLPIRKDAHKSRTQRLVVNATHFAPAQFFLHKERRGDGFLLSVSAIFSGSGRAGIGQKGLSYRT